MSTGYGPVYDNRYQRPNQAWQCGHIDLSCPLGPNGLGVCQASTGCSPIRTGDRWRCNRSPLQGGACEDGPSPAGACRHLIPICAPRRSLRGRRGSFVALTTWAMVGLVALSLGARWRNEVLAPGGLSESHGQILKDEARCQACHAAAELGLSDWVTDTVSRHITESQSDRCLTCHEKTLRSALARLPHGVPPEVMGKLTQAAAKGRKPKSAPDHLTAGHIACATCHREHHGSRHNLTAMTNAQCAVCHQRAFTDFAADHPEFENWPRDIDQSVSFNHGTHFSKYFAEAKRDFDCRHCHTQPSPTQAHGNAEIVAMVGYDQACASCHDESLNQSLAGGIPAVRLPMLDTEVLLEAGLAIGDWPDLACGDFDGRIPLITRILLSADQRAREAFLLLGEDIDFLEIDVDDEDQLTAVADLVWAMKQLMWDLSNEGHRAVRQRLENVFRRELTSQETRPLLAALPVDMFRVAQQVWFPRLEIEVAARQAGRNIGSQPIAVSIPQQADTSSADLLSQGGWFLDHEVLTIAYRASGHADKFVPGWVEALGESAAQTMNAAARWRYDDFCATKSVAQCVRCHRTAYGRIADHPEKQLQWTVSATSTVKSFTKFNHAPHLILAELADCKQCHQMRPIHIGDMITQPDSVLATYHEQYSDFEPIFKQSCASCHQRRAAGDDCLNCHNYHVEDRDTRPVSLQQPSPGPPGTGISRQVP